MAQDSSSARRGRGGRRPGAGRPRRAAVDELILEAALSRLVDDGYEAMTVEAVASQVGVAKTTLYRRWPSKEALAVAAVHRLYADRVVAADTGSLRGDLIALTMASYEFLITEPGQLLESLLRESGRLPVLKDLISRTTQDRRRPYYEVLDRGVQRGELPAEIDRDLVVDLVLGPLWTRVLITGADVSEAFARAVVDTVLDGAAR
jgi:AcrR family transcriptional regulator